MTSPTTLRAAEMYSMAMAEAGWPQVTGYPSGIDYECDADNSVCMRFGPDGVYTPGDSRSLASKRAWSLVRGALG